MDTSVEISRPSSKSWILVLGGLVGCSCLLLLGWFGCFGSFAWLLSQENAHATATAQMEATIATATANARAKEIIDNGVFDTFDSNKTGWMVGKIDAFWAGKVDIKDGMYVWKVDTVKETFLHYSFPGSSPIVTNFDVSVDTKIIGGSEGNCSGILFRTHPDGWEYGGYAFSVCKEGRFFVGYVNDQGKWLHSSDWNFSPALKKGDWNHIEVNVHGSHLILKINDFVVYEMEDSNRANGKIALFIEIHEQENKSQGMLYRRSLAKSPMENTPQFIPVTFSFDNFSFQNK